MAVLIHQNFTMAPTSSSITTTVTPTAATTLSTPVIIIATDAPTSPLSADGDGSGIKAVSGSAGGHMESFVDGVMVVISVVMAVLLS